MWRIQAMAANRRRRRSSGADDIAEAIHRMVDAMQPTLAAQPRTAIAPVRVLTVKISCATSQLSSLARLPPMKRMHGSSSVRKSSK